MTLVYKKIPSKKMFKKYLSPNSGKKYGRVNAALHVRCFASNTLCQLWALVKKSSPVILGKKIRAQLAVYFPCILDLGDATLPN